MKYVRVILGMELSKLSCVFINRVVNMLRVYKF